MTTYTDVFGDDAIPSTLTGYAEVTLVDNTQFYWPELNSEATLIADIMDVTAGGVYNLIMPPANQVSRGRNVLFNNVGANSFYVVDNTGVTLTMVTPGQVKSIYLIDNSDVAGLWRTFTFGTGTSSADASLLNGSGLTVLDGKLAQMAENRSTDTTTTLVESDRASSYVFSNSGSITCNLLAAATAKNGYFVMLSNQGTGSVTLDPYSTETIDGAYNKALAPGESCIAVCDGVNWVTVGYGRSTEFQFTKLVLDVTTGSPFTLSAIQAQNKLLQFIGSPSSNVILNVPKVAAVYYIQGAFSGSNYVQVQTTTGTYQRVYGTDRVIVYCDGENVVLAQTSALPATDIAGGVAGAVVYQSGIGDTGFTSAGTAGQVLTSQGTSAPTWSNLDFASLSGTVPVNKGGTGNVTFTTGGLLRGNGASPLSVASAADIVAAIGSTAVQNATSATTAGRAYPRNSTNNGNLDFLIQEETNTYYCWGTSDGVTTKLMPRGSMSVNYAASANYANSAGSATTATDSTKVAKTGDTMSGDLTVPRLNITNITCQLGMTDTDYGSRHLIHDNGLMGFLDTSSAWSFYNDNAGQVWTKAYGWLHNYIAAASVANADTLDGYHYNGLPYAGINANFDWVLAYSATIASNGTYNIRDNLGYGVYHCNFGGGQDILTTIVTPLTVTLSPDAGYTVGIASAVSNAGYGSRNLTIHKLRKTA